MSNLLQWNEAEQNHQALWRSENGSPMPRRVQVADDRMSADQAYKLVCEGCALLWRGDFQNARQLLQALTRRIERKAKNYTGSDAQQAFHFQRQMQVQRVRILSMLLIPVAADYSIPLRRAPEMQLAFNEAYGAPGVEFVTSLREIQGLIGAHEWRKNGIFIEALGANIHPHYRVFAPTRNEYIDLVAKTELPNKVKRAFDIGTGTGVLAALLAQRGIEQIIATDQENRALSCARDNLQRLGLSTHVKLQEVDLFPEGKADLIVCNPPWLPCRPSSSLEAAIYDPDSRMLTGFLAGLAQHLQPQGQAWLILSDLAERLNMRSREQLLAWIAAGGLKVVARHDIQPRHRRASDSNDPLHSVRAAEVCSLWVLQLAS
jgi:SAM-dependent methyltransferase